MTTSSEKILQKSFHDKAMKWRIKQCYKVNDQELDKAREDGWSRKSSYSQSRRSPSPPTHSRKHSRSNAGFHGRLLAKRSYSYSSYSERSDFLDDKLLKKDSSKKESSDDKRDSVKRSVDAEDDHRKTNVETKSKACDIRLKRNINKVLESIKKENGAFESQQIAQKKKIEIKLESMIDSSREKKDSSSLKSCSVPTDVRQEESPKVEQNQSEAPTMELEKKNLKVNDIADHSSTVQTDGQHANSLIPDKPKLNSKFVVMEKEKQISKKIDTFKVSKAIEQLLNMMQTKAKKTPDLIKAEDAKENCKSETGQTKPSEEHSLEPTSLVRSSLLEKSNAMEKCATSVVETDTQSASLMNNYQPMAGMSSQHSQYSEFSFDSVFHSYQSHFESHPEPGLNYKTKFLEPSNVMLDRRSLLKPSRNFCPANLLAVNTQTNQTSPFNYDQNCQPRLYNEVSNAFRIPYQFHSSVGPFSPTLPVPQTGNPAFTARPNLVQIQTTPTNGKSFFIGESILDSPPMTNPSTAFNRSSKTIPNQTSAPEPSLFIPAQPFNQLQQTRPTSFDLVRDNPSLLRDPRLRKLHNIAEVTAHLFPQKSFKTNHNIPSSTGVNQSSSATISSAAMVSGRACYSTATFSRTTFVSNTKGSTGSSEFVSNASQSVSSASLNASRVFPNSNVSTSCAPKSVALIDKTFSISRNHNAESTSALVASKASAVATLAQAKPTDPRDGPPLISTKKLLIPSTNITSSVEQELTSKLSAEQKAKVPRPKTYAKIIPQAPIEDKSEANDDADDEPEIVFIRTASSQQLAVPEKPDSAGQPCPD